MPTAGEESGNTVFPPVAFFPIGKFYIIGRLRRPDCHTVFRFRPKDYPPRFQHSEQTITEELFGKNTTAKSKSTDPARLDQTIETPNHRITGDFISG